MCHFYKNRSNSLSAHAAAFKPQHLSSVANRMMHVSMHNSQDEPACPCSDQCMRPKAMQCEHAIHQPARDIGHFSGPSSLPDMLRSAKAPACRAYAVCRAGMAASANVEASKSLSFMLLCKCKCKCECKCKCKCVPNSAQHSPANNLDSGQRRPACCPTTEMPGYAA